MDKSETYYNDLIVRYFSGESGEEERSDLSTWLSENEEHRQLFEEYRKTWLLLEKEGVEKEVDLDREWALISPKLWDSTQRETPAGDIRVNFREGRIRRMWVTVFSVAAVLGALIVSSVWIYNFLNRNEEICLVSSADTLGQTLPDGSQVTLAPGSKFSYPEKFGKKSREVRLTGEAFFDIAHDAEKPFIITAGDKVVVEVLGTTFYVNSCNDSGNVEVILISGKLAVYPADHITERIILEPGEKAVFSDLVPGPRKSVNENPNFLAWKTGKIVFNNSRLEDVVKLLNKVYHTDVRLADPAIGQCTITATFNNQSLEAVLKVIRETLSLEIRKNGNIYTLHGPGCL